MPIRPDLGFPYLSFGVLVAVVSAIGLFLGRKWRLLAARVEEVRRRLLVLASEESARAELEATSAYVAPESQALVYSSPMGYFQCVVCFSPSTTRCSRCKAARYCSGKCQIIHWRRGHKEECQPFMKTYQNNYTGEVLVRKLLEQEDEICGNDRENEGWQHATYVQSTPEGSPLSKSDNHLEAVNRNDDSEVDRVLDGNGKDSCLHETGGSDNQQSAKTLPAKLKTNEVKNTDQNWATRSGKFDEVKSGCTRSATSTSSSSGSSADGSIDSFSEPSTRSSGFWDGTMDFRRAKLDACDDFSQSGSSDVGDADLHTSQSSHKWSLNFSRTVDGPNSSEKIVIPDGAHFPNSGKKEPIRRAVLSEVKTGVISKNKRSPSSSLEKSDCLGVYSSHDSSVLEAMDSQYCPPSPTPLKSSRLIFMSADRSSDIFGDKSSTLCSVESKESGSLTSSASIADLSTTRKHSLHGVNPANVDSAHAVGPCDHPSHSLNARNGLKTSTREAVDNVKASKPASHHHSAVVGEVAGRYTNKGLFSYDAFVKLYHWNKTELRPCGLTNCGNSCYANAVLQCLACTPPLNAYLVQGLHSKACEKKEWCFTCELQSLILKAREGISPLSPIRILSEIQKIGSHLGNGREEDAHEFLRYAIDNMQSVCLKEAQLSEPSSLEEETTLIGLTFGGYLRSKIKCTRCGGKSERHERMMDLTVEIEGDIGTLEAALWKFTSTEILDGENKYQCGRCKSYERAKKKMKVQEAPNVLTIVLKRFQSGKFGKLNKSIQFPEILDLAPYMSGTSDKSPIYKLFGVVVHLDDMNSTFSGHYVCYVKNLSNKWYKVDDNVVTAVGRADVFSQRAYMLLYARCSPRAPRLIRNSVVPPDLRKPKNPLFKLRSLSSGPWDEPSNRLTGIECLYPNHSNFHHNRRIFEDDSSSENSSTVFSEGCSYSTESSNPDSSSTDEFFDHLFGDSDQNWNTMWKHSDSDTSSSSSSSSSPTPLYTKRSPLSDSGRHSSQVKNAGLNKDDDSFWVRSDPSVNSCTTRRNFGGSFSSCRETDSGRLGLANIFGSDKSCLSLRRSTRERGD